MQGHVGPGGRGPDGNVRTLLARLMRGYSLPGGSGRPPVWTGDPQRPEVEAPVSKDVVGVLVIGP